MLSFFAALREVPEPQDDRTVVGRALGGDEAAVRTLVRRLMPVIRARVRRGLSSGGQRLGPHDGDDLVQEIWLALIQDGGRQLLAWDPERGASLEGYVGMISEREVANRRRAAGAKRRGGGLRIVGEDSMATKASESPTPEESLQASDLAARLGEHLAKELPERGQLVLRYVFTDGIPPQEAAQIMGVNLQVVYNWQHKIRQSAKTFLSG